MAKAPIKPPRLSVRFSPAQEAALSQAIRQHRRRTGDDCDQSVALRDHGARLFCEQEGIKWPATSKGEDHQ